MGRLSQINPFAKRDDHSASSIVAYKVLTILTWLLSVVSSVYYSFESPSDGRWLGKTIQGQNWFYISGFTLNFFLVDAYWIVLFILQLGYVAQLFSSDVNKKNTACSCGSHFIFNNLLHFAFVMLFVRSHFIWAELILIVNFINLSTLYFRHNSYSRFIHTPVVSGPLAWTFVAIYWNGAIMVPHQNSLVARVFANIFVWGILVYGAFFLAVYKDYTMGFWLSVLSAALGVAQFERGVVAFQWIFAFIILGLLFLATISVAVEKHSDFGKKKQPLVDAERAPLLNENN